MIECAFCKIISGQLSSIKIFENEKVLAFAPLRKDIIAKGHMLVIPKRHYENIYDILPKELNNIMGTIKIISQKLKERYGAEGINILHASGRIAQQSVLHFHMHLIPRYKNDGLDAWPKTGYIEADFPQTYKRLCKLF